MSISRTGSNTYIICTSSTRPSNPIEGMMIYETDTDLLLVYNGTVWVCITPIGAEVVTQQTTTSTSYTDLTTSGPAVTIQTGTKAMVTFTSQCLSSTSNYALVSVAVSGASTIAASDDYSITAFGTNFNTVSYSFVLSGLTSGSNTFTVKYRVGAGTGTFLRRRIAVVGIS